MIADGTLLWLSFFSVPHAGLAPCYVRQLLWGALDVWTCGVNWNSIKFPNVYKFICFYIWNSGLTGAIGEANVSYIQDF